MRSIFILLITLGIFISGNAQKMSLKTPGFLGMRASVKYDFGVMANWDFASKMPYMHHSVELGYALTRKHELVLKYSRMDYKGSSVPFNYSSSTDFNYSYMYGLEESTNAQVYSSNEGAVLCKFYFNKRGYIAPVGRYVAIGVGYIHSVHVLKFNTDYTTEHSLSIVKKVTSHDVVFKLALGRNFVVAKRILISIEGLVNVPVTGLYKLIPTALSIDKTTYADKTLIQNVNTNILLKHLVEFKIGIGSLLF